MLKKISLFFCIFIMIICLDQFIKSFIQTQLDLNETKSLIHPFFSLTVTRNFGAAFGFLEKSNILFRDAFMLIVPPLVCSMILFLVYKIPFTTSANTQNNLRQLTALSFIFGGAMGNYIDRLEYGYVIDYLDLHWTPFFYFPVFNLADIFIVIGVFIYITSLIHERRNATTA